MGAAFKALGRLEQAGVAEYVRAEYDMLVFQQPTSYVSMNAQSDPDGWQERLCEQIASDPERVRQIVRNAEMKAGKPAGFTLIEMSIVLVIIGLIVGGVLVGQSLINAAAVRAQITQIEKYNTATNTFYGKYGYLPGDIPNPAATNFGFLSRGQYAGEGDGNGVIEGVSADAPASNLGYTLLVGETATFWVDLSTARLIEDTLNFGGPGGLYATQAAVYTTGSPNVGSYLPAAKLGGGNYVYVWSTGGLNYFGLSAITAMGHGPPQSNPGLTVTQAARIDSKIDDGLPQSGNVRAIYLNVVEFSSPYVGWAGTNVSGNSPYTTATTGSTTTCFDNGSGSGPQLYSVEINNGANVNCALTFKMQAGD